MNHTPMVQTAPTLGSGNMRDVMRLPPGEDPNEWLAFNVADIVNQVRMLYGIVCDVCTAESCPVMNAGAHHEYDWTDGDQRLKTCAPIYIDYVMMWVQEQLDDENVFPSEIGKPFPRNFPQVCSTIVRRIFRIYAHIYHSHAARLRELKATAHLNTSFKQLILFAQQFELLTERDTQPLQRIIVSLVGHS